MSEDEPTSKELFWLAGEIKTPPFSEAARREAGFLLRLLQDGETLGMPACRPMPSIGPRCHELRINDEDVTWRIFVRTDSDRLLVAEVEEKKTQQTPKATIDRVKGRLSKYDQIRREAEKARKKAKGK